MKIRTFKEMAKGIDIDYFAYKIKDPIEKDLVIRQLDEVSGITSIDYGSFFKEPWGHISIMLLRVDSSSEDDLELRLVARTEKESAALSSMMAARSPEELTIEKEIDRVRRYIPLRFLRKCLRWDNLELEKYSVGPKELFAYDSAVLGSDADADKTGKALAHENIIASSLDRRYKGMEDYWQNEIEPALAEGRYEEKYKALADFSNSALKISSKMHLYEKDEAYRKIASDMLSLASRAATNLMRSMVLYH